MNNPLHITLAGNPNSGKTTLFNHLTGARQHVGNYPGVTVDKKEGFFTFNTNSIRIIDLPGTYSLTAYSVEELVARDYLVNEKPDMVIDIVDASNLERNLYLTTQFLELGIPLVIALNMVDVAEKRGIKIHTQKLAKLLGVPVVPIIARSGQGVDELFTTVLTARGERDHPPTLLRYGPDIDEALREIIPRIENSHLLTDTYPARWTGLKILENDEQILDKAQAADSEVTRTLVQRSETLTHHLQTTVDAFPEAVIADHRYGFIKSILRQEVVTRTFDNNRLYTSDKIDKIANTASFYLERTKVIQGNIANADTPGYRPKDLVFEEELQKSMELKKSDPKH
ncbi:MAG: hypothetical protein DSY58_02100, partial [Desulfobulbus sp.]